METFQQHISEISCDTLRLPAYSHSNTQGHIRRWSDFLPSPDLRALLFRHCVRASSLIRLWYFSTQLTQPAGRPVCGLPNKWLGARSVGNDKGRMVLLRVSSTIVAHCITIPTCEVNENPILTYAAPTLSLSTSTSSTRTKFPVLI